MSDVGWLQINTRNKTAHTGIDGDRCSLGVGLQPCRADACTLGYFADQLKFLADVFEHPHGYTTDYVVLSEAGAHGMANVIATIREVAWGFLDGQDKDWRISLGLLDMAQEMLRTQYRDKERRAVDRPGVHLMNEATMGMQGMFLTVERILRQLAVNLEDNNSVQPGECQSEEEA